MWAVLIEVAKRHQVMLKEIVDETSHGKYDFMYLRIGWSSPLAD